IGFSGTGVSKPRDSDDCSGAAGAITATFSSTGSPGGFCSVPASGVPYRVQSIRIHDAARFFIPIVARNTLVARAVSVPPLAHEVAVRTIAFGLHRESGGPVRIARIRALTFLCALALVAALVTLWAIRNDSQLHGGQDCPPGAVEIKTAPIPDPEEIEVVL